MADILELELLGNYDKPIEIDIDFEGEFVSGSDGQDYKRGYNEGHEKGYADGEKDGYESGYTKGQTDGYEQGKAEGFDEVAYFEQKFNEVTKNGTITNYSSVFTGEFIDDITFKPTCDLIPINATAMLKKSRITNLSQLLKNRGVKLDTSQTTVFSEWLANSTITHIPCISLLGVALNGTPGSIFYGAYKLIHIEKLIVRPDITWSTSAFAGCYVLETVEEIEGRIGTSVTMTNSLTLKVETAKRFILALENYAGTENEFANKITFHGSIWRQLDAEGNTAPDGTSWNDYAQNKGWNT